MLIDSLRADAGSDGLRISARFTWEDREGCEEVAYRIDPAAAAYAAPAPEAFVLLGALAALHHGERRIRIAGRLCPRFHEGLRSAFRLLRSWYPELGTEPAIEPDGGFGTYSRAPLRAAAFLSGGVDSLAALRLNRLEFPADHPAAFRSAIFVVGYGAAGGQPADPRHVDLRARQRRSVEAISRLADLELFAVESRVDVLGEDEAFFLRASHSAHLAAVAHLFGRRITSAAIAASYDARTVCPWGTHPLLETGYGSSAVEIRHEGIGLTRGERTAAVALWRAALPNLIVCVQGPLEEGRLNCSRCEKCLRTMIDLFLAGALGPDAPFEGTLDRAALENVRLTPHTLFFWEGFPAPLRERGRGDFAKIVEAAIARSRREAGWFEDRGWTGALRRIDRRVLGGALLRARRRLRRRG